MTKLFITAQIFFILFLSSCSSISNKNIAFSIRNKKISYCKLLDTLIWERYYDSTNSEYKFASFEKICIPQLVKKTGISSNRDLVGFSGIGYHLDSIFNADIKAWAKKLGCTKCFLPLPRNSNDSTYPWQREIIDQ